VAQVNERFDQPGAIGPGFDLAAAYEPKSFEDVAAQQNFNQSTAVFADVGDPASGRAIRRFL
jgi:hypothetical protein